MFEVGNIQLSRRIPWLNKLEHECISCASCMLSSPVNVSIHNNHVQDDNSVLSIIWMEGGEGVFEEG